MLAAVADGPHEVLSITMDTVLIQDGDRQERIPHEKNFKASSSPFAVGKKGIVNPKGGLTSQAAEKKISVTYVSCGDLQAQDAKDAERRPDGKSTTNVNQGNISKNKLSEQCEEVLEVDNNSSEDGNFIQIIFSLPGLQVKGGARHGKGENMLVVSTVMKSETKTSSHRAARHDRIRQCKYSRTKSV